MLKEVIATGATVEEAKENACKELGVDVLDERIETEILELNKSKVLGIFGGKKAKVKVFIKLSPAKAAEDYLRSVIDLMGLKNITIETKETEKGAEFNIEGEDVGFIIGRRGETLDALQYLTCLAANHVDNSYQRVTINIGDYREKREKTLEILGHKLAVKTVKTGRKSVLEPMNPYERRIIHTAVQKVNGAISWSEGENVNRHVVIGVNPKQKRNNPKGGKTRKYNNSRKPSQDVAESVDRKPLNEGEGNGLYGRID